MVTYIKTSRRSESETGDIINLGVSYLKEVYNKDMISHYKMMDGDVLNIIGIMSEELAYMFRKFNPVERMIMSRDSGLINSYFSLTKNQLIDLEGFATTEHDIHDLDFLNEEFDPVIK